jgi:uncharacterized protein (TIGR02145 family)
MLWLMLTAHALAADCPADLDRNGAVDSVDMNLLLAQWGSSGDGDLDDTGSVNGADLSILLAEWGTCPPDAFVCGDQLVDERDGHVYETALFGVSCWMTENLDHGTRIDGDRPGGLATNDGVVQKFCFDDDPANCALDGALYSWSEATGFEGSSTSVPSDVQGACPSGWHLPSDAEYQLLEGFLGMDSQDVDTMEAWRGSPVGTDMKAGGSSGFEGLLVGWRDAETGTYNNPGFYGGFWTSTAVATLQTDASEAIDRGLLDPYTTVGRFAYDLRAGLSVRCVSDDIIDD